MFAGIYSGGDGTQTNPYQISNLNDLIELSETVSDYNSYFIQTADIDASATLAMNDGKGFIPIGRLGLALFAGVYDGNGKTINNLTIKRPTEDFIGLFGYTNQSTLRNIQLKNASIQGNNYVGALAGILWNGTYVFRSFSHGIIKGMHNVGGLIGDIEPPENNFIINRVEESISAGTVIGRAFCGGLTGYNNGKIKNCYSITTVHLIDEFNGGGLVGENGETGSVEKSHAVSFVKGVGLTGGLIGYNHQDPGSSITLSYWDKDQTGLTTSYGGVGQATQSMTVKSTFYNWDFNNVWEISDCQRFPILQWQTNKSLTTVMEIKVPQKSTTYFTTEEKLLILYSQVDLHGIIYNLEGKSLQNIQLHKGENYINLDRFSAGIYFMRFPTLSLKVVVR